MVPYRSLFVFMDFNGSLWVVIGPHASLLLVMAFNNFFCVLMDSNGSIWILIGPFLSLWILIDPYVSL